MGQSFKERVYNVCAKIPKGRVSTYFGIARKIGSLKSARAVGNALNKNSNTKKIPCHRVVKSNGFVGGYAFGTRAKIKRLKSEGVKVSTKGFIDLDEFGV